MPVCPFVQNGTCRYLMRAMCPIRLRKILPTLVMLLGVVTGAAQHQLLRGVVLEQGSDRPLAGAHVRVQGRAVVVCDAEGRFGLEVTGRSVVQLDVSHVGHAARTVRVDLRTRAPGDVLRVLLEPKPVDIPEFTVRRPEPEVVFTHEALHVGDYLVHAEGVWVLAYERPQLWHRQERAGEQLFRAARLHLLDTLFSERMSVPLPSRVRRLHRDHRGDPIVEGEREAWAVSVVGDGIGLARIGRDTLYQGVLPWTDSIPGRLLGNDRNEAYPAFAHIALHLDDVRQEVFCRVEDRHVMQLFRSQYKYMSGRNKVIAMDLERKTGIDREIIAGHMTGFQHDPYFRVPYAPLFVVDGVPCVFDHAGERIRRFTTALEEEEGAPLRLHRERGYREHLLQDAVSGRVYALFARHGQSWLRPVDPITGVAGEATLLTHPWPEEVQVHGGHAYYVYRTIGSLQHRTLYREPLR